MADELILTLDFETPPRADELGDLFAALARDYRDMTKGRILVVTRVESGSIVTILTDLVLATGPDLHQSIDLAIAMVLKEFYDHLKEWLGRAKSDEGGKRLYRKGKKALGQRSVEAITKVATSTRGHVRIKHQTENGETPEFELTPAEAKKIRQRALVEQTKVAQREHGPPTKVPRQVQLAIEQLHHAGGSNLSQAQVEAMVDLLLAVMQDAGVVHLVPKIASDLEFRGLHNFASALRKRALVYA